MDAGDAGRYCLDLLFEADEDFWLSCRYAGAQSSRVSALFAAQAELRRIPATVSEPPLGEIRLNWWREALDEVASNGRVRAHPVIEALKAASALAPKNRGLAERLIDARARLLYAPSFSDIEDLSDFLAEAEAPLAILAAGEASPSVTTALEAYALGHALCRYAPIIAPSLQDAAHEKGLELIARNRTTLNTLPAQAAGSVAYLSLARGYAARGLKSWPLARRARLFWSMLSGQF